MRGARSRTLAAVTALAAATLGLSACGGSSGIQSEGGVATVRLASSITGSSFLAVTAGIKQGIFAKHQVDVQVIKVKSTAEGTAAIASGDADVAAMLTEGAIAARSAGADLKIIGNLLTQDQHIMYAKPGVKTVADLKGRKLGVVGPGSGTEMLGKALAKDAGIGEKDITYVPTGAASTQLTALISGQIDAAGLVPPYDAKAASEGMVKVLDYRDVFTDLTPQVFVGTGASLTSHKPELTRFIEAYGEAAKWVQDNPDAAVKILQDDAQISAAAAKESYEFAKPDYSTDGAVDTKGLEQWLELTKQYGTVKSGLPTVDELYDPSLSAGTS